ncbi:hypothetical protein [Aliiroseovarius sp.]|uniref:hypothetical protein n=1 Tax=Aliiroseovarius sp. TaxID=1872442 RepID=UPI003BA8B7C8
MTLKQATARVLARERVWQCFAFACLPALIFYSLSLVSLTGQGFQLMQILRDPGQQLDQSSFLGFLSNIGVWVWVSAAAINFFGALAVGRGRDGKLRELLLLLGALSILLAIDDFFMIHDRFISQRYIFPVYAIIALSILLRHFDQIIRTDGFAFLLAGFFLAMSIVTDFFQGMIPWRYAHTQVLEEGFKFVGAATWLYFAVRLGLSFQRGGWRSAAE